MKFTLSSIFATIGFISVSSAYIIPRDISLDQNETLSQYPNTTDFGSLNGTWYLTGITQNAFTMYQSLAESAGFNVDCLQFNVAASSNTTLDVIGSGFLNKTSFAVGVNATATGELILQDPDYSTNTSDHQYAWDTYGSQVFVNKAQYENFTSNGQSTANASESTVLSGSEPFQLTLYTKLIDSDAQPGTNDSIDRFDTIFIWGSQIKYFEQDQYNKRDDAIYGMLLSKTSSIDDDTFNKTVALLPQAIAANDISLTKLNDTCHSS